MMKYVIIIGYILGSYILFKLLRVLYEAYRLRFYAKGEFAMAKGNYEAAIQHYQKALERDPDNPILLSSIGLAYYDMEDFDNSIQWYQRSLAADSNQADVEKAIALCYYEMEEYDDAIVHLEKAVVLDPKNDKLIGMLGNAHHLNRDYATATSYFQKGIDMNPQNHLYYHHLATVYSDQGDYQKAVFYDKQALDRNSNHIDTLKSIAFSYAKLQNVNQALYYLQKGIEEKPDAELFRNVASCFVVQKHWDKALEAFQTAAELDPTNYQTFYGIGLVFENKMEYENAIKYYNKSITINSDYGTTYGVLGFLYFKLGELEKAEDFLKKAVKYENSNTLFRDYKNLGHVYLAKKRKALAIDCYFEAIGFCLDGKAFLVEIKEDLKYLEQYGITAAQYAHITQKVMLEMRKL
jgi:tetratricopeptide (TPR) repeat protein